MSLYANLNELIRIVLELPPLLENEKIQYKNKVYKSITKSLDLIFEQGINDPEYQAVSELFEEKLEDLIDSLENHLKLIALYLLISKKVKKF